MNAELNGEVLSLHRPVLFRYALLQVKDNDLADDVVQETLLSALQAVDNFAGKSGLRTWLIGILKNKIADHWRRCYSEPSPLPVPENYHEEDEHEGSDQDFFIADGHWANPPKTWSDPEAALKQQEFWAIYETYQNNLPANMASVFMLREIVGLEPGEVCQETGISDANYWVTMHRARMRLRECLALRWFDSPGAALQYG
jgi:RNA polymerase sigma-70 factor (ECF subfamily)